MSGWAANSSRTCKPCHEVADKERAIQGSIRSANARYSAALDTYATKKYGENWYEGPTEAIEEKFDRWLESKEDESWQ
jgi:hypothetical protein